MAAGHAKPRITDHLLKFSGGMVVDVPVGLDFVIPDLADCGQRTRQIAFGVVTHGVELHPQRHSRRKTFQLAGKRERGGAGH